MTLRLLVFGSRNLTARHLGVMRRFILAEALYLSRGDRAAPIPVERILAAQSSDDLADLVPDDARFCEGTIWLYHGDGPPGRPPGAIGADKLSEVAASLEWTETRRVKRFPPEQQDGESWGQAAARRNAEMVAMRPDRALCFHENLDMSKGSAMTADFLQRAGVRFRYVRLTSAGAVVSVEDR
jgi:hypothetical protein